MIRPSRRLSVPASLQLYVLVFVGYTLLAMLALRTLVAHFGTDVPGGHDTDYYQFMWNYWWISYALGHGMSPLWTNFVFYPHVSNLSIHTMAAIWYPVYVVADPLVGRVATLNVMVILGYSLSGLAMFAWLRRKLPAGYASIVMAFVGGLAYIFSPYLMTHSSYTQLNLTPLWWYPLLLLLWDEIVWPRHLSRKISAVLFGLALWGLFLTDLQFLVWSPFAIGPYALWTLWTRRSRPRTLLPIIGSAVAAVVIMAALAWIYPLQALHEVNLNPDEYPPAGLKTLYHYSLPVSALIGLADYDEIRTLGHVLAWLAWGAILVTVIAAILRRRRNAEQPAAQHAERSPDQPPLWLWLLFVVPSLLMALGPDITIGPVTIPTGYMVLHDALHGQHRIPSRFTGVVDALLITFIVMAFAPWFARLWRSRRVLAGIAVVAVSLALLIDDQVFNPFPIRSLPEYDIFHQIAQDKRQYVIMDVPVGVQYGWTGIGLGYLAMYYSQVHEHPIINGWLARIPYSTLAYYADQPLYSWLAGVRSLSPQEKQQASAKLASTIHDWPIGYIFAYRDWMTDDQQSEWIGWLNAQPELCPASEAPDSRLIWWQTRTLGCDPGQSPTTQIQIGTPDDWRYIGEGWYGQETIGGPVARWSGQDSSIRLTVDPNTSYELTFSALAFGKDRSVTISSAQQIGSPIAIADGDWHDYKLTIPAGAIKDSLLTFHHNGAQSPGADPRMLAAAYRTFMLKPLGKQPSKTDVF